jgi:TonB family protein
MGKIVKYCSSCDESFAPKFGFCPTCGEPLQSFELNPVEAATAEAPKVDAAPAAVPEPVFTAPTPLVTEHLPQPEPEIVSAPVAAAAREPEAAKITESPKVVEAPRTEPVREVPPKSAAPKSTKIEKPVYTVPQTLNADRPAASFAEQYHMPEVDGGFYVTVIEDKNVKTRNSLLLGVLGIMILALISGVVVSIFNKDMDIGAINGDDLFNAVIAETTPMTVEEEKVKKDKDDAGGGGGGGKNEKEPLSQGDRADQSKTPVRAPDINTPRMENPSIVLPPATTEGNKTYQKVFGKLGDPNGIPGFSNGTGRGGGQGEGTGLGQGNGNGTGNGNGNGSGSGNGNGNGNGSGTGGGTEGELPPPPKHVGVTQNLKILAKPKPSYTDSARQNQVQGTVVLKVMFLANGSIGSISTVKGLPNGLTEQAIAAARGMRFEPAKIDGQGRDVSKTVEFTFSIY